MIEMITIGTTTMSEHEVSKPQYYLDTPRMGYCTKNLVKKYKINTGFFKR